MIGAAVALLAVGLAGTAALARNEHCAGGIQYVVGGMRDKDKGNTEDYLRQMNKAVQQLETCAAEDPADAEAMGYLGWAQAELKNFTAAGAAFQKAIDGLTAKGDKKKVQWAKDNLQSYWAGEFNTAIAKINTAQQAYPDYTQKPANDADQTLREEARKNYEAALASLTNASLLKPNDPMTLRNLGSVHAFMGEYAKAAEVFRAGLAIAPDDTTLKESLKTVRTQHANALIDEKKFDEAVAYFADLLKDDPENADLHLGVADAHFKKAQNTSKDDEATRKAEFKAAGDAWNKAGTLKPNDADLPFNAALAYSNAGEAVLAEAQWRKVLAARPDDLDAVKSLASTLAELQKYDEAVKILHEALLKNPQDRNLHRQLGSIYAKAGNNAKGTEELMIYLALYNGKPVDDPAGAAKAAAGAAQASTHKAMGDPEAVVPWTAQGESYETWFYWGRKQAYHFKSGSLVQKSDWAAAAPASGTGARK
jgi:tetratricopeptide (TPR) repeat protein